jgi:carboxypeptidase family protein
VNQHLRTSIRTGISALLIALFAHPAAAQLLAGRVVDAESGAGVASANVIVAGRNGQRSRTVTDSDGRFSVAVPGAGSYRVQASRTGYDAARTRPVSVDANDTARVDVRLRPAAVRLRAITATARRRRLGVRGVFRSVGSTEAPPPVVVSAVAAQRSIVAKGTFVAPNGCFQLSGVADRLNAAVTLYVQARPHGEGCLNLPGVYDYKATVRGLPPGTYSFRVLHIYRDTGWKPDMPLDTTLTVP